MPDDIDRDAEFEARMLDAHIKAAAVVVPEAQPVGKCLNCRKRLRKGLRWCDSDCRDDWQARKK